MSKKPYKTSRICCNCKSNDTYIDPGGIKHWHKCKCQKDECTKYLCHVCYGRDYQKNNPNSTNNTIKSIANCRTGNLNPSCSTAKGKKSQKLACKLYGWVDLNEENDNYNSPLDCYDPKTGLYYQVKGSNYNSGRGYYPFTGFKDEWGKKFKSMICFCFSEDGKTVERIYKFPEEIVGNQQSISIFKFDSKGNIYNYGWYNKYICTDEEELNKANEIWKEIKK